VKRFLAVLMGAGLALYPRDAMASEAAVPLRQAVLGAERVQAYWALGLCSAAFVALVCVWSVGLKRAAHAAPRRALRSRTRK
jgi:hypothetical protein